MWFIEQLPDHIQIDLLCRNGLISKAIGKEIKLIERLWNDGDKLRKKHKECAKFYRHTFKGNYQGSKSYFKKLRMEASK